MISLDRCMVKSRILSVGLLSLGLSVTGSDQSERPEYLRQTRGVNDPADLDKWRLHEYRGNLRPYPVAPPGTPNPEGGLSQFGGSGGTGRSQVPTFGVPFADFAVERAAIAAAAFSGCRGAQSDRRALPAGLREQPEYYDVARQATANWTGVEDSARVWHMGGLCGAIAGEDSRQ